jgi:hypothetical protein
VAQSSRAIKPVPINTLSVFAENAEKVLLPVQSEERTLDEITAGQFSVGAAFITSCKSTPARDSCVPVRTPYRTRLRAYQGPANPQRITDATANSRQRLRDAHRPATRGTRARKYAFVSNPAARMAPISAAVRRLGLA